MKIIAYNSLPYQPSERDIRWPGSEILKDWSNRDSFAAMNILFDEEVAKESADAYSRFAIDNQSHDSQYVDMRMIDGGHLVSRFFLSRLLIREWAKLLHNGRLNIVLSDEPKAKSRVRSYKGLVEPDCRAKAILFDQHEIEINSQSSVILNWLEVDYAAPLSCFIPLGDTFKAFGIYDWLEISPENAMLAHIASCYADGRPWQWELSRLLPVACASSASIFFLQGVANQTTLQMVVYLPRKQLSAHLEAAKERFAASVSVV